MADPFKIIAGPCVVESIEILEETASVLKDICKSFEVEFYFKSSYRKANRTSRVSFSGIGDEKALEYLSQIRQTYSIPVLTDVHSASEVSFVSEFVDVLQIPAFLCRQTDLINTAGMTGKIVNIKKGQFMAAKDMKEAAEKVLAVGNKNVWLTERGTFFGYNDLVVDFRSLVIMRDFGFPVIFDATHSVQQPSSGKESGGLPRFIPYLAKAAVSVGVDGIFFETHPNPALAKSDSATQLALSHAREFIENILELNHLVKMQAKGD